MSKLMMTVRLPEPRPSLEQLCERFSLATDEVDATFGLVEIDPDQHLFTFLVEESAAPRIDSSRGWRVAGPFSNPRIETCGPPVAAGRKDDKGD